MGHMEAVGLDGIIDDLAELASLPERVVDGILNAEADVIVDAQRSEIASRWRGLYSMGISAKSVKKGKVKITRDGKAVYVYPQGTRKRGKKSVRNAEIAFINEYGAPRRHIAARPAISTANAKKEGAAVEAGEKVYHAYLDSKNL